MDATALHISLAWMQQLRLCIGDDSVAESKLLIAISSAWANDATADCCSLHQCCVCSLTTYGTMTDSDISEPLNELPAYAMQQLARFHSTFMLAVLYQLCNIAIL